MSSNLSAAADGDAEVAANFSVQARAEPGVMPRLIELFAKRGLVPHRWHSAVAGPAMTIDIRIASLDRNTADYVARCMRQVVGVDIVLTTID